MVLHVRRDTMNRNSFFSVRLTAVALATSAVLLTACGGGSDSSVTSSATTVAVVATPAASAASAAAPAASAVVVVKPSVIVVGIPTTPYGDTTVVAGQWLDAIKMMVYSNGEAVGQVALGVLDAKGIMVANPRSLFDQLRLVDDCTGRPVPAVSVSVYGGLIRATSYGGQIGSNGCSYTIKAMMAEGVAVGSTFQLVMNDKLGGLALRDFGETFASQSVMGGVYQVVDNQYAKQPVVQNAFWSVQNAGTGTYFEITQTVSCGSYCTLQTFGLAVVGASLQYVIIDDVYRSYRWDMDHYVIDGYYSVAPRLPITVRIGFIADGGYISVQSLDHMFMVNGRQLGASYISGGKV